MNLPRAFDEKRYWRIVRDCLVLLHGWDEDRAERAANDLWERVAALPDPLALVMLYHTEPFNLADDIAGEPLDYYARRAEYERILARHPIRPKRRSKPRSRVLSGR